MKRIEVVACIIKSGEKIFATERGYGEFKGFWEFPGGKIEANETREQALVRELKEELAVEIKVENFLCTINYDYPSFHLTMHCFYCSIIKGELTLLEHQSAKWLKVNELDSVKWLPADIEVIEILKAH
jgi:8-oxo-dGTP diphosphatase